MRYASGVLAKRSALAAAVAAMGGVSAEEQARIASGIGLAEVNKAPSPSLGCGRDGKGPLQSGDTQVEELPTDPWNMDDLLDLGP